jgi:cobyrinic acid a,c-diamide synthase
VSAPRHCPALFISAPASGQGKTMVTAALARLHRNLGRRVRVFKTGPDFLDPMILERASGNPVYQLDLWMGDEDHCRQLLYEAAGEADLILVEGVMGLFDGEPSSADLAALFNIPVAAVINASGMAQTFGAMAHGLSTYRDNLPFAGVVANQVASERHAEMLAESMRTPFLGAIARDPLMALPDRHLGLVQAAEIEDLELRLERGADALGRTRLAELPASVAFAAAERVPLPQRLAGTRIAVARDSAFSFLYPANLELLQALGAELRFFSPLADGALPDADAVYLPGGYPELHLEQLAGNAGMKAALRAHHAQGKPIVAECGGMLYLLESLADSAGRRAEMAGLLPGHAVMQKKLARLGMYSVTLPEGVVRGHTFHYSQMESPIVPFVWSEGTRPGRSGEPIYRVGRLHASYLHLYFFSNPEATAQLFAG